jgi:hypothetical protein
MKRIQFLCSLWLGLALAGGPVWAGEVIWTSAWPKPAGPNCCPPPVPPPSYCPPPHPIPPTTPAAPTAPTTPAEPTAPTAPIAPAPEAFAQAPPAGTAGPETFNPQMLGDLIGYSVRRVVVLPNGATAVAQVPIAARGAFKIADNESPRPQDRVFFNYNYFNNVNGSINDFLPRTDLHREIFGFEKTFLGGNASVGVRLPIFQIDGDGGVSDSDFGDVSFVLKYAVLNDLQTGNVLSGGLVVTAPTGPDAVLFTGEDIHPTLLQPFVGYIFNLDSFYVHGFTSLVVPTDSRDATVLFNDIGIGCWLYRSNGDGFLNAIVPTFEAHINTPLNNRGTDHSPLGFPDFVVLTGGVHFGLCRSSVLTLGMATPVTGPQPFDVEAIAQFNFRF